MRILGIESSCDETAISVLEVEGERVEVLENLVSSQIAEHQKYGGVVPEVAARMHVPETVSLLSYMFERIELSSIDLIAATQGPGLPTALQVGLEAARLLAFVTKKPIVGVNHLEGHLASAWLLAEHRQIWKFPMLALIVSGGHTELVFVKDFCDYQIIGATRDDAAGEAFDKSAKLMGLPYPGGPQIAKLALQGNIGAISLPRPMLNDASFDFSFSGLKTAVRKVWEEQTPFSEEKIATQRMADLAFEVQEAIVEVLVAKAIHAAQQYEVKGVLLVGGVSANTRLREELGNRLKEFCPGVEYLPSDKRYITDNAAMIAAAGYWRWVKGERHEWHTMETKPNWEIGQS